MCVKFKSVPPHLQSVPPTAPHTRGVFVQIRKDNICVSVTLSDKPPEGVSQTPPETPFKQLCPGGGRQGKPRTLLRFVACCKVRTNPYQPMNSQISGRSQSWTQTHLLCFPKTFTFPVGVPGSLVTLWGSGVFCFPLWGWQLSLQS